MNQPTALERNKIWDDFLAAWPVSRVKSMTLEEYTQAGGRDTFTYWIEGRTDKLGSIWGGSAFKFGIYHMDPRRKEKTYVDNSMYKSDGVYAWYSKSGLTREEAFAVTKKVILDVIDAVQVNNLEAIGPLGLGRAIKWKIASLYQNRLELPVLPIFNKNALKLILGGVEGKVSTAELQGRIKLFRGDADFWSFFDASWKNWMEHKTKIPTTKHKEEQEEDEADIPTPPLVGGSPKYWLYAPGEGGEFWDDFYEQGIMAIGWDFLGDLNQYATREDVRQALKDHYNNQDNSKKNDTNSCFVFGHVMKPGDIVFAKTGIDKIVGVGTISSEYFFDADRDSFRHLRRVDWTRKGEWTVAPDMKFHMKTITEMTSEHIRVQHFLDLVEGRGFASEKSGNYDSSVGGAQYWWLNANPKIWNFSSTPIGSRQTYTSHNEAGNKRRVYQYFTQVRPGDFVIGYVSTPLKQITAMCRISKALHDSAEGEVIEFEKTEQFSEPIPLKRLQSIKELEQCEPLINNQGSLFKVKPDEFEIIRSIIDEENAESLSGPALSPEYSKEDLSRDTGYDSSKIESWLQTIARKKQAVFFGPPGTGKTYIAERLARNIVSETDGFYESIQFHPSYSYEEFMQGIRPDSDEKGNLQFELKAGRFMEFCSKARVRNGPCVLIIDELNRANLSKVFGELMFLLEYRDREMALAGGHRFSIPENVRIIGTMNTADRSIALVDFALRRRFAFIELAPEYDILGAFQKKLGFDADGLIRIVKEMNARINDKHFHIGISFFMDGQLQVNLERIWTMEIEPYLEEYFFGQAAAVENFRWSKVKDRALG